MGGTPKGNVYSVYVHTTPDGKKYVGMTGTALESRWKKGRNYAFNRRFTDAVEKYGWENVQHEIVASGLSHDEALDEEARAIARYNTTDEKYGYNDSPGHNLMSEQARQKMIAAQKLLTGERSCRAKPVLQIEPNTMRVINRYVTAREASLTMGYHKNTVSQACRRRDGARETSCSHGYFWTYESDYDPEYFSQFAGIDVLESGRLPRTGEREPTKLGFTKEEIQKATAAKSKPVRCVETGQVFANSIEAGKAFGIDGTAINHCVRGKTRTAAGHRWQYA